MIELKIGELYTAARARQGESPKGPWQFAAVREDGKGRKEILIWVDNRPQPIAEGGKFRLGAISSVKFASRKDNAGVWHDECNITASIEPVMDAAAAAAKGIDVMPGFSELDNDGELPF